MKKSSVKSKTNKVILYSSKTCQWCAMTKEFFRKNKIKFTNKDISIKKNADESVRKSKQLGIPVIDINGKIIVGYNEDKLRSLLKVN